MDHPPVPVSDQKASLKIDVFYAMVSLGSTMIWSLWSGWLMYFYLPPQGEGMVRAPAAFYGVTILATRIINALLAPAIGRWSDHARSRWGRRLPFMFVAALPMLFFFVLMWTPPVGGQSTWNLVYLAMVLLCYNTAYGVNQIPYMALLPELAQTDHHRVRMSAWSSGFFLLGVIVSAMAGPLIERAGYVTMALVYAGAALPLFYLPFLVLRERPGRQIAEAERLSWRESVRAMLRNRAFVVMTATGLFYWGITILVQSVIPYLVTEVCLLDMGDTVLFYVPAVLASLLCYPLVMRLSDRWGKFRVFAGSLLLSALALPGVMLIGDWLPVPLKAQGILWVTLQAVTLSGVSMLPPAFGAEITDQDEKLTGQRREGTYYAAWGVLDQVVNGLVAALLPLFLLLGRSHTDPHGPLGVRLVGVFGGAMMLAGFFVFLNYPLRGRGRDGEQKK